MSLGEWAYFFMKRVSMELRLLSAYQWVQTPPPPLWSPVQEKVSRELLRCWWHLNLFGNFPGICIFMVYNLKVNYIPTVSLRPAKIYFEPFNLIASSKFSQNTSGLSQCTFHRSISHNCSDTKLRELTKWLPLSMVINLISLPFLPSLIHSEYSFSTPNRPLTHPKGLFPHPIRTTNISGRIVEAAWGSNRDLVRCSMSMGRIFSWCIGNSVSTRASWSCTSLDML